MSVRRILFGEPTSRVTKVMWMAAEAAVPYEHKRQPVQLLKKDSAYLRLNPKGTVPTWVEEGRDGEHGPKSLVLNESNSIVAYIAAQYGKESKLYPTSAAEVASCWQWQEFGETSVQPALSPVWWGMMKGSGYPPGPGGQKTPLNAEKLEASVDRVFTVLAILNDHLSDGRQYIGGPAFTFGDVTCGVHTNRLFHIPQLVDRARQELPYVGAWYGRLLSRPPYAEHVKPFAK